MLLSLFKEDPMASKFLISLTAFSLTLSLSLFANDATIEEALYDEVAVEEVAAVEKEAEPSVHEEEVSSHADTQQKNRRIAFPQQATAGSEKVDKEPPPKKMKPHYAGARRPQPKPKLPEGEKKKSSHVKNPWFSSKTHPKVEKKERAEEKRAVSQLPDDRPHFIKTSHGARTSYSEQQNPSVAKPQKTQSVEDVNDEGLLYPRAGFQAPKGHVYLTGEWLYWRTRQEGMEFATAKTVEFDFQSGFRVGLGSHLPWDHWDIFVNYTRFIPDASSNAHGLFYPLFFFNPGGGVAEANAHWKIEFNVLDVDIGRVYYISETLIFRPFVGLKGAWIDQHAHVHYQGGVIPAGQTYRTQLENDFKGAGPLLGIESNWQFGAGFSIFGDLSTALVVGHFDNKQQQYRMNDISNINLNSDFNLVSPMVQMVAGLAWDRNFHQEQCHVGLSAGFETQYWWGQNQTEQFTDSTMPIYIRQKGPLSFYGLTVRGRFDF